MDEIEKRLRKGFEEVTTRNVKAGVAHSNKTREIVRELENKIESLRGQVESYDAKIKMLQTQLINIQAKIFSGGTQ